MGNRITTPAAALLSDPARRHAPSSSQFFGSQHFKKWTEKRVLCSDLCSRGFHVFGPNELACITVLNTVNHVFQLRMLLAGWLQAIAASSPGFGGMAVGRYFRCRK